MSKDPKTPQNDDEAVGYGKPPKAHQFKPGQSGNPKGRPKRSRNFKTLLIKELDECVTGTENGRTVRYSKSELIIKSTVGRAIKGDHRATEQVIGLVARTIGFDPADPNEARLSESDAAILDSFVAHQAGPALPESSQSDDTDHTGDSDGTDSDKDDGGPDPGKGPNR